MDWVYYMIEMTCPTDDEGLMQNLSPAVSWQATVKYVLAGTSLPARLLSREYGLVDCNSRLSNKVKAE